MRIAPPFSPLRTAWRAALFFVGIGVGASHAAGMRTWTFDDVPVGKVPPGWRVGTTNPQGPLPTWAVVEDPGAPSDGHALAMLRPNHRSAGTFNLCWTDVVSFQDGTVEVKLKALRGHEDQGGGVVWRFRDPDNYYVARFNPLEDNFRLYVVRNGRRHQLASARVHLPAGRWHTLKIVQHGTRFEGDLDGRKLLEGEDDTFEGPGAVGLWTKADAVTAFDNFTVHPDNPR